MNISKIMKDAKIMFQKRSPEILTGIGIAGMITTTVLAVRATPKAMVLIEEEKKKHKKKLQKKEVVKVSWKLYIPAFVTGTTSICCIIAAASVNTKRKAALATAYTLAMSDLKDYKSKVLSTIGEKKEKEVRDAIAKDKLDKNPAVADKVIATGHGDTLCYDSWNGRYFESSMEWIKHAENELNRQLLDEGSVSLNDLYYAIGLDETKAGDILGWDSRSGLVTIAFSSQVASEGKPCLVFDFTVSPYVERYN